MGRSSSTRGRSNEDTLSGSNAAAVEGAYAVHPACLGNSTLTTATTAALARRDFIFRYGQRHGGFSGFAGHRRRVRVRPHPARRHGT